MAKQRGSARQTAVRDVTGVPGSAGPTPNAGVLKRVHKGGGTAPKGLGGDQGKGKSK
jgi:hypothetical protein